MQRRLLIEVDLSLKKAFEIILEIEAAVKNTREIQSNGQQKSMELNAVTLREHRKQLSKIQFLLCTIHDVLGVNTKLLCVDSKQLNKKGHIAKACRSEGQ